MADESTGFVYRFPDRDFELGVSEHIPEVGDKVTAKGHRWRVVQVESDSLNRALVSLEQLEQEEPEAPLA